MICFSRLKVFTKNKQYYTYLRIPFEEPSKHAVKINIKFDKNIKINIDLNGIIGCLVDYDYRLVSLGFGKSIDDSEEYIKKVLNKEIIPTILIKEIYSYRAYLSKEIIYLRRK